jgi:type I restriction enzyme, S subunit
MSEWLTRPLSAVADIRVSNVDKKSLPGEEAILLCNYMDAYANDYIRSDISFMEATASGAEIAKFKLDLGDVVITKDSETPDDIGIPAVVVDQIDNLVCGYHLALLKTRRELVDPIFLSKQLSSHNAAKYFGRRAAGSTRYGLSNRALASFPVSLPTLPKQKKIAAVLRAIDTSIEKTEALIDKYRQIKAGLMHDLFTRGVLPNGQLRPSREQAPELYQETPIGWIPKEWRGAKLGTMAKIVSGVTLGAKEDLADAVDAPYLRVANVQDGYLDLTEIKTVKVSRTTLEYLRLQPGDVLMNEGGDFDKLGRGAVWAGEIEGCVHQNHVFRVRADANVLLPHYLAFYSESSFGKKYFLLSSKQSTNLASINSTQLNAYPIALPAVQEQDGIIRRLNAAKRRIEALQSDAEKLRRQKLGLMQDLLTGKVPVRVEQLIAEAADG